MKATKYHAKNTHTETCVFEEWKQSERKMGYCGKPAVGNIGKSPCCQEHFAYAADSYKCDVSEERLKMT